jgi:hypothetical protein
MVHRDGTFKSLPWAGVYKKNNRENVEKKVK